MSKEYGNYELLTNTKKERLDHVKFCAEKVGLKYKICDAYDAFGNPMAEDYAICIPEGVDQRAEAEAFFDLSSAISIRYKERLEKKGYPNEFLDKQIIFLGCEKHFPPISSFSVNNG